MKIYQTMFPTLADYKWAEVDLADVAKRHIVPSERNPLLDPKLQTSFVNVFHESLGVGYSYGGYMEDRSFLWRGMYMMDANPPRPIHLGIDFNVPALTPVYSPFGGTVVRKSYDGDQDGGWGVRIDVDAGSFYWILAHIDNRTWSARGGDVINGPGTYMGQNGWSHSNGGWFPHVHLQCVSKAEYESVGAEGIDGYGVLTDELRARYPDPRDVFKPLDADE